MHLNVGEERNRLRADLVKELEGVTDLIRQLRIMADRGMGQVRREGRHRAGERFWVWLGWAWLGWAS